MKSSNFFQGLLPGFISSVVVTWAGFFVFQYFGIPFLPAGLADVLFAILPGNLQLEGITLLGYNAKPLALFMLSLGQILSLALIGKAVTQSIKSLITLNLVALGIFAAITVVGTSVGWDLWKVLIGALGLATIHYVLTIQMGQALEIPERSPTGDSESLEPERDNYLPRRRVLAGLASGAGALMLWPVMSQALRPAASTPAGADLPTQLAPLREFAPTTVQHFDQIPGLPSAITPLEDFYYISKNIFVHSGNASDSLKIGGMVDRPISFSLEQLQEMPSIEEFMTLMCIEFEPNNPRTNDLISTALWKGVRLKDILAEAGVDPSVTKLELHASDSYSTVIPLSQLIDAPETMIAYEMNGIALSNRHGFPVRLIAPGLYGYKNVKHITGVNPTDQEFIGYWERRGWAIEAPVKLMSRISTPAMNTSLKAGESVWIAGIAHSGNRGISKVEVNVNDGESWFSAELEQPLSNYSWTRWALEWTPLEKGVNSLQVRAYDGNGVAQPEEITKAFPSGATGYHRFNVFVS